MDMPQKMLAVDVGGVIIDLNDKAEEKVFQSGLFLHTSQVEGAIEAVARLSDAFDHRVLLVSRCDCKTEDLIVEWLVYHGFRERTGIPQRNWHLSLDRSKRIGVCRNHQVTHVIDDRLGELALVPDIEHQILFRPTPAHIKHYDFHLKKVRTADSWDSVLKSLLY